MSVITKEEQALLKRYVLGLDPTNLSLEDLAEIVTGLLDAFETIDAVENDKKRTEGYLSTVCNNVRVISEDLTRKGFVCAAPPGSSITDGLKDQIKELLHENKNSKV